jgi:hypothetical protein
MAYHKELGWWRIIEHHKTSLGNYSLTLIINFKHNHHRGQRLLLQVTVSADTGIRHLAGLLDPSCHVVTYVNYILRLPMKHPLRNLDGKDVKLQEEPVS